VPAELDLAQVAGVHPRDPPRHLLERFASSLSLAPDRFSERLRDRVSLGAA
jgi:hypothetical protein